jgi:sugar phosphate permease
MAFFWQPTYYTRVYGLSLEQASLFSILPWAASAVFTNLAGWAADALINSNSLPLTAVRKLIAALASFGPACCLLALSFGLVGACLHALH